jgi:Family of unknown function (DUF6455)
MACAAAPQRQPTLMREMMERLGIDPGAGVVPHGSLSYLTALHRCEQCSCKQLCHAWLAKQTAAVALPPSFCPNADILFEMQVDQPGPHYGDKSARMAMRWGGI